MLYERDIEYVVEDNARVVIVDEFTGRLQYGRRYSDGLHQAIEAKENVQIERETQTIATITLQNRKLLPPSRSRTTSDFTISWPV